jgi:putative SOS response-associated peptidase YedK
MCYSAMVWADWHLFRKKLGVNISITDFYEQFYKRRRQGELFPKAMDAAFSSPQNDDEQRIRALIDELNGELERDLQSDIFKQQKRLNDAQRKLQTKVTKKATEDVRIASNKIDRALVKLHDIKRTELKPRDSRIFPNWYAPVLINDGGQLRLLPMRYHCRPAGMPASSDWVIDRVTKRKTISGKYNARRDNLERFWRKQFGYTHGIAVMSSFFENVPRHKNEGRELKPGEREENMVLHFNPQPPHDMLVACLWSHWQDGGDDLYSFAAITDEPPPEIAAAGHDRCIIPIKEEHLDAWLHPDPQNLAAMHAILDDRDRPFYEYEMAA